MADDPDIVSGGGVPDPQPEWWITVSVHTPDGRSGRSVSRTKRIPQDYIARAVDPKALIRAGIYEITNETARLIDRDFERDFERLRTEAAVGLGPYPQSYPNDQPYDQPSVARALFARLRRQPASADDDEIVPHG